MDASVTPLLNKGQYFDLGCVPENWYDNMEVEVSFYVKKKDEHPALSIEQQRDLERLNIAALVIHTENMLVDKFLDSAICAKPRFLTLTFDNGLYHDSQIRFPNVEHLFIAPQRKKRFSECSLSVIARMCPNMTHLLAHSFPDYQNCIYIDGESVCKHLRHIKGTVLFIPQQPLDITISWQKVFPNLMELDNRSMQGAGEPLGRILARSVDIPLLHYNKDIGYVNPKAKDAFHCATIFMAALNRSKKYPIPEAYAKRIGQLLVWTHMAHKTRWEQLGQASNHALQDAVTMSQLLVDIAGCLIHFVKYFFCWHH